MTCPEAYPGCVLRSVRRIGVKACCPQIGSSPELCHLACFSDFELEVGLCVKRLQCKRSTRTSHTKSCCVQFVPDKLVSCTVFCLRGIHFCEHRQNVGRFGSSDCRKTSRYLHLLKPQAYMLQHLMRAIRPHKQRHRSVGAIKFEELSYSKKTNR